MKLYLNNLIKRIEEFSESLDKQELFIDKPWVIVDNNMNQQKYIFRRNGELIMSLNGKVSIGKWEYLFAAKSILIDRLSDKILLNQNFIDPAVMILKMDGFQGDNLILANEFLIPDLNVLEYIKQLHYKKNEIRTMKLANGDILEIFHYEVHFFNKTVTIKGEDVLNGKYELNNSRVKLLIENSKLMGRLIDKKYNTKYGEMVIEQFMNFDPVRGNLVFINNNVAPDGEYKLSFFRRITVENGRII